MDHPPPSVSISEIKKKSVRGGVVTMLSQGFTVAIQLASTVVLARLLSPDDYGVAAMVLAITSFANLFRDLGLSAAAIQKGNLSHPEMSNLFWLNVAMGTFLTLVLSCSAPLVAWFYGKSELTPLTLLLSSTFLISSLGTQHGALMQRQLFFGRKACAGIGGSIGTLTIAIILALQGKGYWALAWGQIGGNVITTSLLFYLSPFRPGLWKRGEALGAMLKFGASVTAFDFVNYFQRNLDGILIGRVWGAEMLGNYSRAYQLLMFPITNLRGPINAVAFPAMSRMQHDAEALKRYYLSVTSIIAFLSMPLTAMFFVASEPIIDLALGPAWSEVSPIFSYLAIAGFIQPASGFAGSLLLSLGQGKRYLQCGAFNAIVISMCFIVGVSWGATGVAISYAVGTYLVLYPWLTWAFSESPVTFKDFARTCAFPAILSITGGVAAWWCRQACVGFSSIAQIVLMGIAFLTASILLLVGTPPGRAQFALLLSLRPGSRVPL